METRAGVPWINRKRGSREIRRSAREAKSVWKVSGMLWTLLMMAKPPKATRIESSVEAAARVRSITRQYPLR
jgi:hypothetical protein